MVSSCSLSNDRSLTKILIENSTKNVLKSSENFCNKLDWVDGLNQWSFLTTEKIFQLRIKSFDFHQDIGLYLPKDQKKRAFSNDQFNNTSQSSDYFKDLIGKSEESCSTNEQLSSTNQTQVTNSTDKQRSNESRQQKLRFPLRQIQSKKSFDENPIKQNENQLEDLLKEQLNHLLKRQTSNLYSKRTVIKIPSIDIKHQNSAQKSFQQTDTNLLVDKYSRIQQLIVSPSPISYQKIEFHRQSPCAFQGIAALGLTVTPLEIYNSNQLSQQQTPCRPSTQSGLPVYIQIQTNLSLSKSIGFPNCSIMEGENSQTSYYCPSGISHGRLLFSTDNSSNEQTNKKSLRLHRQSSNRSTPKHSFQRSNTFHLLPNISGKRIQVSFLNQKNS